MFLPSILFSVGSEVSAAMRHREGMMFMPDRNCRAEFGHFNVCNPIFALERCCGGNDWAIRVAAVNRHVVSSDFAVVSYIFVLEIDAESTEFTGAL